MTTQTMTRSDIHAKIDAMSDDEIKVTPDTPKKSGPLNPKNEVAWTWALALVNAAGGSPSPDVLALVEREKRGEITTDDMIKYVTRKYQGKERG